LKPKFIFHMITARNWYELCRHYQRIYMIDVNTADRRSTGLKELNCGR
jgi:hypothetical protein